MEDPGVTFSVNMHTYAKPKERLGNFIERIGFTMFFEMDILFLFILVNIFRNRKISHVIRNIIGSGSYVSIHYLTLFGKKIIERGMDDPNNNQNLYYYNTSQRIS